MRYAVHANYNQWASVSIRTNGLDHTKHEICDICVLVLDSEFKPSQQFKPFWTTMVPRRPKDYDPDKLGVTKEEYFNIVGTALDADTMADLFEEWWGKLQLKWKKKIEPVAYDWPFIEPFLTKWLGHEHMKHFFSRNVRDVRSMALLENDKADHHHTQCPFLEPHLFQAVSRASKVKRSQPHNVLQDAMCAAASWRNVLKHGSTVVKVVEDVNLVGGEIEMPDLQVERTLSPRS